MNLRPALICIALMKEHGVFRGHKIGRLKPQCQGVGSLEKDEIIIFRPDAIFEGDPTPNTCCIERPMSADWIAKQLAKGSLIMTTGTMVGVPRSYIDEIET